MLENEILPGKPFGLELTHGELEDIGTRYVQKKIAESLDTMEGN
jgi:hypothetical protein